MKLTAEMVEGFVGSCLAAKFDNVVETPDCHREWWNLCCSDDKFVAIAAPRGHAKSTAITHSYVLAALLFRERMFVVIVSDTETQACQFLRDLTNELVMNEAIHELFGVPKFIKSTDSDIIVEMEDGHKFRVLAKGSGQSLRGLKWDNKRPDLIIGDDLENDEIVLNFDRREKFRKWVYGALIPCLSPTGAMRLVGTILHLDSFLENLMPRSNEKGTQRAPLKIWNFDPKRRSIWRSVKYEAHDDSFENILWPQMWPKERLKALMMDFVERGLSDVYSQEMRNIPLDPSKALFRKGMFLPIGEEELLDIQTGKKPLTYYVAGDFALSEKERADWTVFIVAGRDADGVLYILDVIRSRMTTREMVDTIFQLHERYNPMWFALEKEKISKAFGPFLEEEMLRRNRFPNIYLIQPSNDKQMRARSIQGRMGIGSVKFDKSADWYYALEDEMLTFPRGIKDDQVDAMAYLGLALDMLIETPTEEEEADEEYEHELRIHEISDHYGGRSRVTGY